MKTTQHIAAAVLSGAIALAQPIAALAACAQADAQGTKWRFQTIGLDGAFVSCIVAVNASGDITKAGACTFDALSVNIHPTSNLTLASAGLCLFKGRITITAGGDSLPFVFKDGALSMDREKVTGISLGADDDVFFFTLTKISG